MSPITTMQHVCLLLIATLGTLIVTPNNTSAQVNSIIREAENNNNDRSASSGGSSSGGTYYDNTDYSSTDEGSYNYDDDDGSSFDGGASCSGDECLALWYIFAGIVEHHQSAMERELVMPWITGAELRPTFGFMPRENALIYQPEVRLNYGVLGTQFRVSLLEDNTGRYETLDWQLLTLNFYMGNHVIMRYGNGFMTEEVTGNTYYETSLALEGHSNNNKYFPSIEYRLALDGQTSKSPRQELNARFQYLMFEKGILHTHVNVGYQFQRYYNTVNFHFAQVGLNIGFY